MREFFGRLFGGSKQEAPAEAPQPTEARKVDAELVNLRERKFRAMLDEFSGRKIDNADFAQVKKELNGGGDFPELTAEEMRAKAKEIAGRLFSSGPELVPAETYDPADDQYEAMGTRRKTFEKAFAEQLGRPVTREEMSVARKMFEMDDDIQKRWSTLVGEEVAHYAKGIAQRIESTDMEAAAK